VAETPARPAPGAVPAPPAAEFAADAAASSSRAAASRPYGRLLIFTLLDDKATDFDRLAEQTAEEVQTGEPDTLVYVIHLVPNAPMQRIFYEIYRDRAAFDSHENKSYMQRFVTERRAYVLATNVIELRLKYAKVAPLPQEPRSLDAGRAARAQPLPTPPAPAVPGPAMPGPVGQGPVGQGPAIMQGPVGQVPADPRYGRP
jgi:quinol monooxygenase YgiN